MKEKLVVRHFDNAQDMMIALPLVQQLYENMDEKKLRNNLEEMIATNDYKMIAVFLDNKLVGV